MQSEAEISDPRSPSEWGTLTRCPRSGHPRELKARHAQPVPNTWQPGRRDAPTRTRSPAPKKGSRRAVPQRTSRWPSSSPSRELGRRAPSRPSATRARAASGGHSSQSRSGFPSPQAAGRRSPGEGEPSGRRRAAKHQNQPVLRLPNGGGSSVRAEPLAPGKLAGTGRRAYRLTSASPGACPRSAPNRRLDATPQRDSPRPPAPPSRYPAPCPARLPPRGPTRSAGRLPEPALCRARGGRAGAEMAALPSRPRRRPSRAAPRPVWDPARGGAKLRGRLNLSSGRERSGGVGDEVGRSETPKPSRVAPGSSGAGCGGGVGLTAAARAADRSLLPWGSRVG